MRTRNARLYTAVASALLIGALTVMACDLQTEDAANADELAAADEPADEATCSRTETQLAPGEACDPAAAPVQEFLDDGAEPDMGGCQICGYSQENRFATCMQQCFVAGGTPLTCRPSCCRQICGLSTCYYC
jgi:hypothetical protein